MLPEKGDPGGRGKFTFRAPGEGTRADIFGLSENYRPRSRRSVAEPVHRQGRQWGELPGKYPDFLKVISIGGVGGLAGGRILDRQLGLELAEVVDRDLFLGGLGMA